ncbi:MAG: CDP-2,3-bis-(O-geranylgeranyl)-sn-glycerol synthase [Euryarchaeota archaeon]|nr:CDP-2,3-bis-(O-geranylgeranyl)-sn-glycerol synthase [Euryarchaeota archaeon]
MFSPYFVVQALWLFLPAYVANMAPVFLAKIFPKWDAPIDGGRARGDGTRLLGDGKTWRGLIGGAVVAALVALLQSFRPWDLVTDFGRASWGSILAPLAIGFMFGLGALVGDAVKSYFKRKSGRPRGAPWIGPDQLDFVVGGLLFAFLTGLLLGAIDPSFQWAETWFVHMWWIPPTLIVVTPLLHWLVNVIGYWLGLKEVPW